MVSHDGQDLGWGEVSIKIPEFVGTAKIKDLPVFPFRFLHDQEQHRDLLSERGRVFVKLMKPTVKEYIGQAEFEETGLNGPEEKQFSGTGHIMVNPVAFYAHRPNSHLLRKPWIYGGDPKAILISNDSTMFYSHLILGFSFSQKQSDGLAVSRMAKVT